MNTFRKILQVIIVSSVVLFLAYSIHHALTEEIYIYSYDCGTVKSKSQDDVVIKYGTRTELYLNCQFDKKGFIAKEVNPTTYFKYNLGDRVCFEFEERNINHNPIIWGIGIFTGFLISLILIVMFVYYIFTGEKLFK